MKRLFCLFIAVLLTSSIACAGEEKTDNGGDFWQELIRKIEEIKPKKKAPTTTAVGGVRGNKAPSEADNLYWKGEEVRAEVSEEEIETFRTALSLAQSGMKEEALQLFGEFLERYGESPLRGDALLARQRLTEGETDRPGLP